MRRHVAAAVVLAACRGGSSGERAPELPPCPAAPAPVHGQATFYAADGTGSCSFEAAPDRMVAALNGPDYDHAALCGACLAVTGPMGEILVRVVDQCPGCKHGDLDLSREAFGRLAPLGTGRVPITWQVVDCGTDGTLAYRFKDGSNAFWTAIQLRNHRYPITKLEAKDARGAYKPIARADYNYFVATSGLGKGPYTLRVTDARGHIVEDSGIALGDAEEHPGAGQLPACP